MSYRIMVRKDRGVWWWTTGFGRDKKWNGPWRSRAEAFDQAHEAIVESSMSGFVATPRCFDANGVEVAWDGSPLPPPPPPPLTPPIDLRQMAWLWWPELR